MTILVDTNVLLRAAEPGHGMHRAAVDAVVALRTAGHDLCVVPQVLYEFWAVSTRPTAVNGLGKDAAAMTTELAAIRRDFVLLADTSAVLPTWERLVSQFAVLGKNAHDARLVAAMMVHGVTHILTFNDADFRRFTPATALNPSAVLAAGSPPVP